MSDATIVIQAAVKIRRGDGCQVKPEAEQIDGRSYTFQYGWRMDDDDPYPGEDVWIAHDPCYPPDAPIWIASGDLASASSEASEKLRPREGE